MYVPLFYIKSPSANYAVTVQTEHLRAERDVLRVMKFPFVVRLLASFQDEECVYFVMEYSCGGEFFRHLKARGRCGCMCTMLFALKQPRETRYCE